MIATYQIVQINKAVKLLKQGQPIAFPTDTVYGLGSDPNCESAIKQIFILKERSFSQPLPILLPDVKEVYNWVDFRALRRSQLEKLFWQLAEKFWPGALTIVARKKNTVSDLLTANTDAIAIRIPNHPVILSLLQAFNSAIIGTSANKSSMPSAVNSKQVKEIFGSNLFVIDDDRNNSGSDSSSNSSGYGDYKISNNSNNYKKIQQLGSTIVSLIGPDAPKIIRHGAISKELLGV